jgi:hypothetical protein
MSWGPDQKSPEMDVIGDKPELPEMDVIGDKPHLHELKAREQGLVPTLYLLIY